MKLVFVFNVYNFDTCKALEFMTNVIICFGAWRWPFTPF